MVGDATPYEIRMLKISRVGYLSEGMCSEPLLLGSTVQKADAEARTRTWDNLVNSEVLYHLSYFGSISSRREHLIGLSLCPPAVRYAFPTSVRSARR